MTKKDFELIAKVFREWPTDKYPKNSIIIAMANSLEKEFPRFDRRIFILACVKEGN